MPYPVRRVHPSSFLEVGGEPRNLLIRVRQSHLIFLSPQAKSKCLLYCYMLSKLSKPCADVIQANNEHDTKPTNSFVSAPSSFEKFAIKLAAIN